MIYWIWLVIFVITNFLMFTIKTRVQNLSSELKNIKVSIRDEESKIHMLKTEFTYLTSASYLRDLSSKYLQVSNITVSQVISNPLNDSKKNIETVNAEYNQGIKTVKWRYKSYHKKQ